MLRVEVMMKMEECGNGNVLREKVNIMIIMDVYCKH